MNGTGGRWIAKRHHINDKRVMANVLKLVQVWANFLAEGPQSQIPSFKGPQYGAKAVSKLDCHAIEMKNMLTNFENIIHPQYGNALHVYNAFIRYQAVRKRE